MRGVEGWQATQVLSQGIDTGAENKQQGRPAGPPLLMLMILTRSLGMTIKPKRQLIVSV
jgi:hypothetical protein